MKKKSNAVSLEFPDAMRKMAKMGAACAGINMSEYVASLVLQDASRTGIAALVSNPAQAESGEVNDGQK